jgi:hypothetical protein
MSSSGIACTMNCCIMKMPNAGATHGTTSENQGFVSPDFTTRMKSGTRITANGTESDENITANRIRLPRNRNFAKPYPAIAQTNTDTTVAIRAVPTLMPNQAQNGWVASRFV